MDSAAELEEKTKEICALYEAPLELAKVEIKLYSTDDAHGDSSQRKVTRGSINEKRQGAPSQIRVYPTRNLEFNGEFRNRDRTG